MSNLIKRSPFFPSTLLDDFFSKDFFDWSDKNFSAIGDTLPSVNLKETEKGFDIEMAVPGLKKDDFKIELKNGILTISSEKKEEKSEKDKKGNYTRREFNYQSFMRSFTVPETVAEDKADATYKDGILHVTLAKKAVEAPKAAKQIAVN
ncbi:MAG: Hsp20/alpha crystallin family protein [Bacteroidetes bacterium]|nr:Hsp20/alpha crystallin family protein [Bacteroidota bacterium]